jgi:hypothetical protein
VNNDVFIEEINQSLLDCQLSNLKFCDKIITICFLDLLRHLLTALLLSLTMLTAGIKGDCVMRDVCNTNGFVDQNCPYAGPAIPLNNQQAEGILAKLCPDFFSSSKIVRFIVNFIHKLNGYS